MRRDGRGVADPDARLRAGGQQRHRVRGGEAGQMRGSVDPASIEARRLRIVRLLDQFGEDRGDGRAAAFEGEALEVRIVEIAPPGCGRRDEHFDRAIVRERSDALGERAGTWRTKDERPAGGQAAQDDGAEGGDDFRFEPLA